MKGDGIVAWFQAVPLCFGGFKKSYVVVTGRTELDVHCCVVVGPGRCIYHFLLSNAIAVRDKVVVRRRSTGFGESECCGCSSDVGINPRAGLIKRIVVRSANDVKC